MTRLRLCAPVAVSAIVILPITAFANGRFPRAQRLVEQGDTLALYGTYGLMVSHDGGQDFHHICEAATGTYTGEDPLLEITPHGALLVRTEAGLMRSLATPCDYTVALGEPGEQLNDITRLAGAPDRVLALSTRLTDLDNPALLIRVSDDAGVTWSSPRDLPGRCIGLSVDVAPSDPERWYVSAIAVDAGGVLLRSSNAGETWETVPIAATDLSSAPYIAAISPSSADRIFVRTDRFSIVDGLDTADDSLFYSGDAGETWHEVFNRKAKLFGFAISPDSGTLLLGYGDPVIAATGVFFEDLGIYRASLAELVQSPASAEEAFSRIYEGSVTCLRWTSQALYACVSQSEKGFELGRRDGADFDLTEAEPFEPLLLLDGVVPLACPAQTAGSRCYSDPNNGWPAVCRVLGADCDAGVPPAIGGTGGSSGTGGEAGMHVAGAGGSPAAGSAGTSFGQSGTGPERVTPAAPQEAEASGCGCRAGVGRSRLGLTGALLAIAAVLCAWLARSRTIRRS